MCPFEGRVASCQGGKRRSRILGVVTFLLLLSIFEESFPHKKLKVSSLGVSSLAQ